MTVTRQWEEEVENRVALRLKEMQSTETGGLEVVMENKQKTQRQKKEKGQAERKVEKERRIR